MNGVREFFSSLAYPVAGLLVVAPAFALQLLVLMFHLSWLNLGLDAIALLFSLGVWAGVSGAIACQRILSVNKFIDQFPASRFEAVDPKLIEELVTPEMQASLFLGSFVFPTKQTLPNVYRVEAGGNDRPLGVLASYESLSGPAFIFLNEPLKTLSARGKFSFFHEIGHSGKRATSGLVREVAANTWVWNIAWIFLFAQWDRRSGAALALIVLAQAVFWYEWDLWPRHFSNFTLSSEVEADRYALQGLTASELDQLTRVFDLYPQEDPVLDHRPLERGNLSRNFQLLREIETILRAGSPPERAPMESFGRKMLWKNLASLIGVALIGQSVTPWRLWAAGIAAILQIALGIFSWRSEYWHRGRAEYFLRTRNPAAAQVEPAG